MVRNLTRAKQVYYPPSWAMKRWNRHSYLRKEGMPTQGKQELTHGVSKATQHLGLSSPDLEATHVQSSSVHVVHDYLYELWWLVVCAILLHTYNIVPCTVLQKYILLYFYNHLLTMSIIHTLCISDLCVQLMQPEISKILIRVSNF